LFHLPVFNSITIAWGIISPFEHTKAKSKVIDDFAFSLKKGLDSRLKALE